MNNLTQPTFKKGADLTNGETVNLFGSQYKVNNGFLSRVAGRSMQAYIEIKPTQEYELVPSNQVAIPTSGVRQGIASTTDLKADLELTKPPAERNQGPTPTNQPNLTKKGD